MITVPTSPLGSAMRFVPAGYIALQLALHLFTPNVLEVKVSWAFWSKELQYKWVGQTQEKCNCSRNLVSCKGRCLIRQGGKENSLPGISPGYSTLVSWVEQPNSRLNCCCPGVA